ncbi:salivary glue protein Sgs-7 [Drosophila busckii]|uniref:salivary glue protein Sgs-7 n=1 Tax=Drosophila busckii TaxID=30019 RepID=UPI00083EADC7|nr:salivary glue protein Sgs-7 [Drosophila busckii]
MKFTIVFLIVSCILLSIVQESTATGHPCAPCGPAGRACEGCPSQDNLCRELIQQFTNLRNRVRTCVCGMSKHLL